MTTRQCAKCKKEFPANLEYFYQRSGRRKGTLLAYCKGCFNAIQKDKHKELKKRLVDYKGGKCVICGYNRYFGALEFHHLDPTQKELKIGQTRRVFSNLQKEADKCVLVCGICHPEIHGGLHPEYLNNSL